MATEFERLSNEEPQIKALYDLLLKRNHRISHQRMPSYAEHYDFFKNHPYRAWFLLKNSEAYIGSFYITDQNTVGINVLDEFMSEALPLILAEVKSSFSPLPPIKSIRGEFFSVNVAPDNVNLIAGLEKFGCKLAQVSYVIV
jgi:hypothetical protein